MRKYTLALLGLLVLARESMAQITLPDPGVDVSGFITAFATDFGTILVVIVGFYFAFLLIRKAIKGAAGKIS